MQIFCVVIQRTFRQLHNGQFSPNLATKRTSVSCRGIRKGIFENFHFRAHLPPKSEIESRSNSHLTQSRLQITGCTAERYCLLHVVFQGPGSFQDSVNFLYDVRLQSYGASKLLNFRTLAYFPHTKPLKRTFCRPAYSPGVTSQNDTSGRGAGDPQTCPVSPMANGYTHTERTLLHGASYLDQRCLKTCNYNIRCTFPPNIFTPYPQNHPKTPFWEAFSANPITETALRKSIGCMLMQLRS